MTTNCKQVIEKVQAYLLDWMDDYKQGVPEWANDPNEVAFVKFIDQYMHSYGANDASWRTPRGVLLHFVEGGDFDCYYYSQVNERLREWGLNPERYKDGKNWETYCNLICRDGARLYEKVKKG